MQSLRGEGSHSLNIGIGNNFEGRPGGRSMTTTEPRALRLVCPQGCGDMLTVPVPTLTEVNEMSGDPSLKNLDTLIGRNVVGAVLVHCLYTCTAVPDGHPMMRVGGSQAPSNVKSSY
jgi:hypothetical protein